MNNAQCIEALLMRLQSRYSKDDIEFFENEMGHSPIIEDLHNYSQSKVTTSQVIRQYLKLHQANKKDFPCPFKLSRLEKMNEAVFKENLKQVNSRHKSSSSKCPPNKKFLSIAEKGVAKFKKKTQKLTEIESNHLISKFEKITSHQFSEPPQMKFVGNMQAKLDNWTPPTGNTVDINMAQLGALPILTGALKTQDGGFHVLNILPDSGASMSCSSALLLEKVGKTIKDLTPVPGYKIKTANGLSECCGKITLTIYLSHHTRKVYHIFCEVLILPAESCTLDKLLLSYGDLIRLAAEWKFTDKKPSISLECFDQQNKLRRKKFLVNTPPQTPITDINLTRAEYITANSISDFNTMNDSGDSLTNNMLPLGLYLTSCKSHHDLGISQCELPHNEGPQLKGKREKIDISEISETNTQSPDYDIAPPLSDLEDHVSQRFEFPDLAMTGKSAKITKNPSLPKVDHLPEPHRTKFQELFKKYEHIFSQGTWDLGLINWPPIRIEYDKNNPAYDPPRPLNDNQFLLLTDACDKMVEAGIIQERSGDTRWNSNLMAVPTSTEENKRMNLILADCASKEDRLEILRKGLRPVLDLRSCNKKVGSNYGTLVLPRFEELLSKHHNRVRSGIDLRKAFFQIPLHESCREIFSFRVRSRTFQFLRLVQGFSRSPNIMAEILSTVLSEASFERFKLKYPILKNVIHDLSFLFFVDDITILSDHDLHVHYLLWLFVCIQFDRFDILINPAKCSVAQENSELLGYQLNSSDRTYCLNPERALYFRNLRPPATRQALISILSLFNYFRSLVPALKLLCQNMLVLARSKNPIIFKKTHYREFF